MCTFIHARRGRVHAGTSMHGGVQGFINWITLRSVRPRRESIRLFERRQGIQNCSLRPFLPSSTYSSISTALPSLSLFLFSPLLLLRHPPHTILFLSRRQDTESDGRESRSSLSVPRAPTWPISTQHSFHVLNVLVKHRVYQMWPYHQYR